MEITLPISKKIVVLREMRGSEEKLLLNEKLMKQGKHLDEVLRACITHIDGEVLSETDPLSEKVVLDFYSGDRNYILYQLRILSYGPEMEFSAKCTSCGEVNHYNVDLQQLLDDGTIEVVELTEGQELSKEIALPSSNGKAVICAFDGHRERRVSVSKERDSVTIAMATMQSLDGKNITRGACEKLPARDLATIREQSKELVFGLIPKMVIECNECGSDFETLLSSHQSFFVPR